MKLPRWIRPRLFRGKTMRGRIHRIAIVQGGEVSVVVRFGIDEPQAKQLLQGGLVELAELSGGKEGDGRG